MPGPGWRSSRGPEGRGPALSVPHLDPVAVELTRIIHGGDLPALRRLVAKRPELATVHMIGRRGPGGGWRTPLHVAADWSGCFPGAPAAVALLEAGANPTDDTGGERKRPSTGRPAPTTSTWSWP